MYKILMSFTFSVCLLTGYSFAQVPATVPNVPATQAPAAMKTVHHERDRHPELHKALHKLREAKQDLQRAAHDYGGHKVAAIEAINHAIAEVQSALDYAQAH